jgi:hypothetical protein
MEHQDAEPRSAQTAPPSPEPSAPGIDTRRRRRSPRPQARAERGDDLVDPRYDICGLTDTAVDYDLATLDVNRRRAGLQRSRQAASG